MWLQSVVEPEARARRPVAAGLLALTLLAFVVVLVRTAWLSDDAYITARVADLFVHGDGPNFNVGERVQGFTHPLWMLLLTGVYALTRDAWVSLYGLGFTTTLVALFVFVRHVATSAWAAIAGVTLWIFSRACVDYSTSGLENPASHLLLVVFLALGASRLRPRERLALQSLCVGLLVLNRLDLSVLGIPLLAAAALKTWREERADASDGAGPHGGARVLPVVSAALCGLAIPAAWLLFALVYYGFPFPNTAYAKLATGVARSDLWGHGFRYVGNLLRYDYVTAATLVAALLVALASRRHRSWTVAIALLLQTIYVISVGGDFMGGRFFSAAFVLAAGYLAGSGLLDRPPAALGASALAALLGLLVCHPTITSGGDYGLHHTPLERFDSRSASDERAFYYCQTGLLRAEFWNQLPYEVPLRLHHPEPRVGADSVIARGQIGMYGFGEGRDVFIIDFYALTDPLLARLPTWDPWDFYIGHFGRKIPEGYEESVRTDSNRITDPKLARIYDDLRTITRGPLFTTERFRAIWRMNTASCADRIDRSAYVRRARRKPRPEEEPPEPTTREGG